jgi:hypothetical protein
MIATRTPPNGARTTSPARSCSAHSSALVMKLFGRRNVHSRPDARTSASACAWYRETALSRSSASTALAESSTARRMPASRARVSSSVMPSWPLMRNTPSAPSSALERACAG